LVDLERLIGSAQKKAHSAACRPGQELRAVFHPEYELDVSQLNERAILFVAMLGCISLGQVLCEASLQRWRKKKRSSGLHCSANSFAENLPAFSSCQSLKM
jgi:hypothetical protein